MNLVNVKNNIKSFWEENKKEIIDTGIAIGIGIAVGKVICWKLDSQELKKLKKLTGDTYPNLGFLANSLGKSKGMLYLDQGKSGISAKRFAEEALPELKDILENSDVIIQDCVVFTK